MPDRRPDALWIPDRLKRGKRFPDRVRSILAIAEPILGIDRAKGESAQMRLPGPQDRGRCLVTPSAGDTLYFAKTHPRSGEPRYRWDPPDARGIERGYLVEGANGA